MCMVEAADGGYWARSREAKPKARKAHRCNECGRDIQPGEQYRYFAGIHTENGSMVHKCCSHCEVASKWLLEQCNGYIYSAVAADIAEHINEVEDGYSLARLWVGMKRKWKRFDGEGLMGLPRMPRVDNW